MSDMRINPGDSNADPDAVRKAIEPLLDGVREEIHALRNEVRSLRFQRDPEALLNKEEAADLLGVSERTVDTLLAEGAITSIKVRRCRRIPRGALEAYIRRKAGEDGRRG